MLTKNKAKIFYILLSIIIPICTISCVSDIDTRTTYNKSTPQITSSNNSWIIPTDKIIEGAIKGRRIFN